MIYLIGFIVIWLLIGLFAMFLNYFTTKLDGDKWVWSEWDWQIWILGACLGAVTLFLELVIKRNNKKLKHQTLNS